MEEKESRQKELFKEFSQPPKRLGRLVWALKRPIAFRPLVFVFSYEKFIFLIISLVIILAVVFALGVERGKRITQGEGVKASSGKIKIEPKEATLLKKDKRRNK